MGNIVLRDRRQLSTDGILIVVVTMDRLNRRVLAGQTSSHAGLSTSANPKNFWTRREKR